MVLRKFTPMAKTLKFLFVFYIFFISNLHRISSHFLQNPTPLSMHHKTEKPFIIHPHKSQPSLFLNSPFRFIFRTREQRAPATIKSTCSFFLRSTMKFRFSIFETIPHTKYMADISLRYTGRVINHSFKNMHTQQTQKQKKKFSLVFVDVQKEGKCNLRKVSPRRKTTTYCNTLLKNLRHFLSCSFRLAHH